MRELKDRPESVSALTRVASGEPFARCAVREISGVQLLEQKSAASSVSIECVSMEEEAFASGTDSFRLGCFRWVPSSSSALQSCAAFAV